MFSTPTAHPPHTRFTLCATPLLEITVGFLLHVHVYLHAQVLSKLNASAANLRVAHRLPRTTSN